MKYVFPMKHAMITFTTAVVLSALAMSGCELEPASETPAVTPETATVRTQGDTVQFTALEGFEFSWSLETDEWGTLSSRKGKTTTYTSTFVPESNSVVQVVTLTSTVEQETNASLTKTAQAFVTHLPAEESTTAEVAVSPQEVVFTNLFDSATFTASGGDGEFDWDLEEEQWGTLSDRSGSMVTYTNLFSPTSGVAVQRLTVFSAGQTATALIKQQ
jgi:hypothetical protein